MMIHKSLQYTFRIRKKLAFPFVPSDYFPKRSHTQCLSQVKEYYRSMDFPNGTTSFPLWYFLRKLFLKLRHHTSVRYRIKGTTYEDIWNEGNQGNWHHVRTYYYSDLARSDHSYDSKWDT